MEGPAGVSAFLPGQEGTARGYVAGIRVGKRYVSFYLMPLYVWPALATDVSPELLRRKQGKACFNFKAVDKALLAELAEVTRRGIERFRAEGLPEGARPYV